MLTRPLAPALLLIAAAGLVGCESARLGTPGAIAGRYIVTIGDADMTAATLATGELGERDPSAQDMLTVVGLPIREPVTPFAQVNVSNSALCPPTALSVTRDGRFAFVVDVRGPADASARTIDDLPKGNSVTAVSLVDPMTPGIVARIEVPAEPIAVGAHPTGAFIAVATHAPGRQIVIVPFDSATQGGSFTGEPAAFGLLGIPDSDALKPSSIAWSPDGTTLALTLQDRGQVMLYRFSSTPEAVDLRPWGEPVTVGLAPYTATFTPDGRHLIVNDLQWPQGSAILTAGIPQGRLVSVALADPADEASTHTLVSQAPVGINPVAVALSSDGRLAVTANMGHTPLPPLPADSADPAAPTAPAGGSLSLLTIDENGNLTPAGEYALNALPAGVSFDAGDNHVCVTQFRSFDPEAIDGELGFWTVRRSSGQPTLEAADFFVGVGKGPHGVLIVR